VSSWASYKVHECARADNARTLLQGVEAKLSGKLTAAGEKLRPPRQK
jgi:hypothetical protein